MKTILTARRKKAGIIMVAVLAVITLLHLYVPIQAQPGDANDPLVTRRYVDDQITELRNEIATLRHMITGMTAGGQQPGGQWPGEQAPGAGFTQADRDAIFMEVMLYFETMYGDMLRNAATNAAGIVPFDVLNVPAGTRITFDAGVEFILRSGNATVVAGVNGIPDITAGLDIGNGQRISTNHLLMVPVSDGRGAMFTTDSWIMIRGSYRVGF